MATLDKASHAFPHIAARQANGKPEPYVRGTGLAVWEIAWLWRVHEGNIDALMEHLRALPINRELIDEALAYARLHPGEIDPVVEYVETMTEERLKELFPGIQVISGEPDGSEQVRS